jgi:hypothetical protein
MTSGNPVIFILMSRLGEVHIRVKAPRPEQPVQRRKTAQPDERKL